METNADANAVLTSAKNKARRLQHHYISVEHLLHGMLLRPKCTAIEVFKKIGLQPVRILNHLETLVSPGPAPLGKEQLSFTPRVKKILELAGKEAASLGSAEISSAHILLGLLREHDNFVAQFLRNFEIPELHELRDITRSLVIT